MSEVEQSSEVVKPKAKGKKGAKPRKARRESITAKQFVDIYKPLAEAGKSAKEIAEAMGRDTSFVTMKATLLRNTIKKACEKQGLSAEQTKAATDMVPYLRGKGRPNVLKMLGIVE